MGKAFIDMQEGTSCYITLSLDGPYTGCMVSTVYIFKKNPQQFWRYKYKKICSVLGKSLVFSVLTFLSKAWQSKLDSISIVWLKNMKV